MGAVPKHRPSKRRQRNRRAHDKLTLPHLAACERCNEPKLLHHACPKCGYYKGREIVEIES
jgi:large subunit ribosomal protein L32